MKNTLIYIPFPLLILLDIISMIFGYEIKPITPYIHLFLGLILLNLIISKALKVSHYFLHGLTLVSIAGALEVIIFPEIGQIFLKNIIAAMYLGLFLITIVPPIFKLKPFTYEFSVNSYPESITKGQQFHKINLIINYIWSVLFASAVVLSVLRYNDNNLINKVLSTVLPIFLLLSVGIPVTKLLPNYLLQKVGGEQVKFNSIKDLFTAMPFGLNKEKSIGIDTVIQFFLSGSENTIGYLSIYDQKCTYTEGIHPYPKTTIHCDSKLWLDISNKDESADKAYIHKLYRIEGDATIMLKFADMFTPPSKSKKHEIFKPVTFNYKQFEPNQIKNIVVFDGGFRNNKFSKTSYMVNHFIEGAKESGASVEYFKLKNYDIKECAGCYTCWTKSPGKCIHKDDMAKFLKIHREANLVVYASPLYIFNVTGILKTFMDRLLPILKPYMLINENGNIRHPDRMPEKGQQGFVVFSASGFPEVAHNFDGLIGMFRAWDSHNENLHLMGEFYMPASEMIAQSVYEERKGLIKELCYKAGKQIIEKGYIDKSVMNKIQDPLVTIETFQNQANTFWESLDGIKSYLNNAPKISNN